MRRDEKLWRLRVAIQDRPGALATLATTLGVHDVDVLRIDVVSRDEVAVDDIWLELPPGGSIESLDLVLRRVPGVAVRALFPVAGADDPVSVMAAACGSAAAADAASFAAAAIEGACQVGVAEHALLLDAASDGSMNVVASTREFEGAQVTSHEPCLVRDAAFGGLPLAVPASYPWAPERWRAAVDAAWVAAIPLMRGDAMSHGLILVRQRPLAFESGELSRLAEYARVLSTLALRYELATPGVSADALVFVSAEAGAEEALIAAQ